MSRKTRLDPSIFNLPVERMRAGYYSDKYFVRTREVLLRDGYRPRVTMQVFAKQQAFLGGIDETIAILKLRAIEWSDLEVWALHDGDEIKPWERDADRGPLRRRGPPRDPVPRRAGPPHQVGTNTRRVVEAANGKEIMRPFRPGDHWLVQTGDGYAAHIAGAIRVSTDAQASWWGSEGLGTVPHAMIAAFGGNTVLAARKFAEQHGARDQADHPGRLRERLGAHLRLRSPRPSVTTLYGVRLDTSEMLVDRSVIPQMGQFRPTGVCPQLVWNVRHALDRAGYTKVNIVVSGGFTVERISHFEQLGVPVNAYGVGSSLFQGRFDFTADVVRHEGRPCAKVGREYRPNPRLERVQ
jgi:nicotinate phosphoribosyltransferase